MENYEHLWKEVLTSLKQSEVEMVAILLRNIWLRQNELAFNKVFKSPSGVAHKTNIEWENYHLAMEKVPRASDTTSRANIRWLPPEAPRIKTNWDAAIYIRKVRNRVQV